jgi:iron complex outermembrane receptor protein
VGVKSDLFERRARLDLAAFDTEYDDLQVSQLLGSGITLNNAGKARIRGFEAELAGYLAPQLRLEGSFGYLDPKYDSFQNCTIPQSLGGGVADCSGKQIIGAAKYTLAAAAQYEYPIRVGRLVARLDYHVQSPVFFEATNSPRFESDWRHLLDARLGLSTGHWDVFLWGRNLTNDTYVTYRDDRSAIGVLQTTAYGDPRTYGVSVTARF